MRAPNHRGPVEQYHTVEEVCGLLGLCARTVRDKLAAGEFGDGPVNLGSELRPRYRIPASAVNRYLAGRRVRLEPSTV